jgi:hypothetical protein
MAAAVKLLLGRPTGALGRDCCSRAAPASSGSIARAPRVRDNSILGGAALCVRDERPAAAPIALARSAK